MERITLSRVNYKTKYGNGIFFTHVQFKSLSTFNWEISLYVKSRICFATKPERVRNKVKTCLRVKHSRISKRKYVKRTLPLILCFVSAKNVLVTTKPMFKTITSISIRTSSKIWELLRTVLWGFQTLVIPEMIIRGDL